MKMEMHGRTVDMIKGEECVRLEAGYRGGRRSPTLAHLALRQFLLDMVALVYEVEPELLLSPTRGRKKTAFARQVAMYLAHTGGGLSLSCVGRLFERDRTTVSHACALIEDARDDMVFDRSLGHLESAIACQIELFWLSDAKSQAKQQVATGGFGA